MRTIAIWAASTVLAAVGGSTASFAVTSAQADAGSGARAELSGAQPASFVRSEDRVVPVTAGDDHRSKHVEPGDDHGRHEEPGDDHGRHGEHHHRSPVAAATSTTRLAGTVTRGDDRRHHAEPGDDRGHHAEPGDDRGRRAEPGDDRGRHGGRHGSDG